MRRAALALALALALLSVVVTCGPLPPTDRGEGRCWTLEVVNDRFERATLYHGWSGRRILAVEGKTRRTQRVCHGVGGEATLGVRWLASEGVVLRAQGGGGQVRAGDRLIAHLRLTNPWVQHVPGSG